MKNIVIGTGLAGSVTARLIATELKEDVVIIDKRNHIAGNCYDRRDKNGIMIQKYGAHIFHTNNERVWNYIKQFSDFNMYAHKVKGVIDGIEANIPFNFNTLYQLFPDTFAKKLEEKLLKTFEYGKKISVLELKNQKDNDLKFLANYIYEKVFLNYTIKQWGITPEEIDKSVIERVPVFLSKDDRYFQDKYQGIPIKGYSAMIEKMLNHPKIKVLLNTDFNTYKKNHNLTGKRIFYTGSIDEYYEYKFGILAYRSVDFKFEEHNKEFFQSNATINYPNDYDFTRIHEFKYFLSDKSNKTVIAKEYPSDFEPDKNERCYPVINKKNQELYNKYLLEAKKEGNVYFLGRLGSYQYLNMDSTILQAIELFEDIKNA